MAAVALAVRPDDFLHGEELTPDRPPDDDGWEYPEAGLRLTVHPRYLLDADDRALLTIWRAWQGGGMGPGHLPFAGGSADQPACVMACLRAMDGAAAALRPKRRD